MTRDDSRAAVILAGGRSTRFGEADKATAPLGDKPMIRHVADRVAQSIEELVVNCRADQEASIRTAMESYPRPVTFAFDDPPDRGPVAGIATGLEAVSVAPLAFVVACDMPFVEAALVDALFEAATHVDAAVPRLDDEWLQTTHAVYRTRTVSTACRAALAADERRIVAALERVDMRVIDAADLPAGDLEQSVTNVNTAEELAAAEEQFKSDN